jgi:Protein of unknown function (DUF2442)
LALMRKESDTEQNSPTGVKSKLPWRVKSVKPLSDFQLAVVFVDKTKGVYDCKPIIFSSNAGVFAQLQDVKEFNDVNVAYGAVTWGCGLDMAPDAMYEVIRSQ